MRQIVIARINTLMHLPPDNPLSQPPTQIHVTDSLPEAAALRTTALAQRPDLRAAGEHESTLTSQPGPGKVAEFVIPDFTPFAMYDRFMGNTSDSQPLATMIGVSMNVPVRRDKRFAAVSEAQARLNQRRAELEKQIDLVNFQVQEVFAKCSEE